MTCGLLLFVRIAEVLASSAELCASNSELSLETFLKSMKIFDFRKLHCRSLVSYASSASQPIAVS